MLQWLKKLFSGTPLRERRLGELTQGATDPEQAIVVSLTFLVSGQIQGHVEEDYLQVSMFTCKDPRHNGTYRIDYEKSPVREVLDCTLDEFIEKFKVSDEILNSLAKL